MESVVKMACSVFVSRAPVSDDRDAGGGEREIDGEKERKMMVRCVWERYRGGKGSGNRISRVNKRKRKGIG